MKLHVKRKKSSWDCLLCYRYNLNILFLEGEAQTLCQLWSVIVGSIMDVSLDVVVNAN